MQIYKGKSKDQRLTYTNDLITRKTLRTNLPSFGQTSWRDVGMGRWIICIAKPINTKQHRHNYKEKDEKRDYPPLHSHAKLLWFFYFHFKIRIDYSLQN